MIASVDLDAHRARLAHSDDAVPSIQSAETLSGQMLGNSSGLIAGGRAGRGSRKHHQKEDTQGTKGTCRCQLLAPRCSDHGYYLHGRRVIVMDRCLFSVRLRRI